MFQRKSISKIEGFVQYEKQEKEDGQNKEMHNLLPEFQKHLWEVGRLCIHRDFFCDEFGLLLFSSLI